MRLKRGPRVFLIPYTSRHWLFSTSPQLPSVFDSTAPSSLTHSPSTARKLLSRLQENATTALGRIKHELETSPEGSLKANLQKIMTNLNKRVAFTESTLKSLQTHRKLLKSKHHCHHHPQHHKHHDHHHHNPYNHPHNPHHLHQTPPHLSHKPLSSPLRIEDTNSNNNNPNQANPTTNISNNEGEGQIENVVIKEHGNLEVIYPSKMDNERVRKSMEEMMHERTEKHLQRVYGATALLPVSLLMGLLPGPNVFFAWNCYRLYSNYQAWKGGKLFLELEKIERIIYTPSD